VSLNPTNETVEIRIGSQSYEVISHWRHEESNRIEVTLKGKKCWELEFFSIYKTF